MSVVECLEAKGVFRRMAAHAIPQGTLDLLILTTLAGGPRHGYAIARWIEETTDDVLSIEEGSLYPALYRMERRGLIAAKWARSDLGKVVKRYSLTAVGRRHLESRTKEWGDMAGAVAKVLRSRTHGSAG